MSTIVKHSHDHRGMKSSICPRCKTLFAYWDDEDLDEDGNLRCYCEERDRVPATGEAINALDFDHPFTLHPDGTMGDALDDVWAPEVYHSETDDIEISGRGWRALTGMTGQDGYHGAVMHASEFIGGGIAEYLLELAQDEPQTFVVVVVECLPDEDDDEPEPAGWAILIHDEEA